MLAGNSFNASFELVILHDGNIAIRLSIMIDSKITVPVDGITEIAELAVIRQIQPIKLAGFHPCKIVNRLCRIDNLMDGIHG